LGSKRSRQVGTGRRAVPPRGGTRVGSTSELATAKEGTQK